MVRQQITAYKMLTPQRRSEILVEIEARRAARIAGGLPPDTPEQDETVGDKAEQDTPKQKEAEQFALDMEMEDARTEDENEEEGQIRIQGGPNGG